METFSDEAVRGFEDRVLGHLRRFFGPACAALGEPAVRETIRYGVQRARAHGIEAERDVCKYVDLLVVFGRDFDVDPALGWPARILAGEGPARARLEALYDAAIERTSAPGAAATEGAS